MNERRDDGSNIDVVHLGEYDGEKIYVFYPEDATDEDIKTMWIRSPESGTTSLIDQQ